MAHTDQPGRRRLLGRLAGGVVGSLAGMGCLQPDREPPMKLDEVAPVDDLAAPSPSNRPEIAGWPIADGALLSALMDGLAAAEAVPPPTQAVPADRQRSTFEATLGDRLATFDPPSTFLTVAGQDLARYVRARHLHPIPDLLPAASTDWFPAARATVDVDGQPFAVPVAAWPVNHWFVNEPLLDRADVAIADLTDPTALAQAVDRIEARTEAAGIAVAQDGAARLALLCDCLGGVAGGAGLAALSASELLITPLERAAAPMSRLLTGDHRHVADAASAAERVRTEAAAFTRVTPRRATHMAASEADPPVRAIPAFREPVRLTVLAMPYPKRNPSPVASERVITALQTEAMARRIAQVPGLLPGHRSAWPTVTTEAQHQQRALLGAATEVVPAPSTGCAVDPSDRLRVVAALGELTTEPTVEAIRNATASVLA